VERRGRVAVAASVTVAALALAVPLLARTLDYHRRQATPSTQQQAKQFILDTMPRHGTYLAMEMYTPNLPMDQRGQLPLSPIYAHLNEAQRRALLERPYYEFQYIPLYSTRVELSAFYYDLRHYLPYRDLDTYGRLLRSFAPNRRSRGPLIQIYAFPEAGKKRLLADRGALEPGFYRAFADRLHAPHFLAFVEGVAAHALQQEKYGIADLYYTALLENSPPEDRPRVTEQLAFVKLRRAEWTDAERLYRRVVTDRPRDAIAAGNYGFALENLGKLDEARRAYERCIQLDPGEGQAAKWARERLAHLGASGSGPSE
jgi:tetratricopeptide (TPR) repeat protein